MKHLVSILFWLLVPLHAEASLLRLSVTGEITSVDAGLHSSFSIGDSFEVLYDFDPNTPDLDPSTTRGQYELRHLSISTGNFYSATSLSKPGTIFVDNNVPYSGWDRHTVNTSTPSGFYQHDAALVGDRDLIAVVIELTDLDAGAFGSDASPTVLDLNLFETAQLDLLFSND